ncbi:hypothetical protein TcBrA4_0135860 [Trypanosoma cruzi]|nr:hypothetical protein TcBrA4_0135860 [Trypanosoma cruzi]
MSCGRSLPPRAMIWVGSCVLWSRRRRRWRQSLEAVTTERDELREELAATSDDLGRQLRAVEAGEDGGWSRAWRQWTTERDELAGAPCATSDDLGRQLRAVEQAKTEVEQSLEAMMTERDELREEPCRHER